MTGVNLEVFNAYCNTLAMRFYLKEFRILGEKISKHNVTERDNHLFEDMVIFFDIILAANGLKSVTQ